LEREAQLSGSSFTGKRLPQNGLFGRRTFSEITLPASLRTRPVAPDARRTALVPGKTHL